MRFQGDYHLAMVEEAEEENTATGWLAQKLAEYKQVSFLVLTRIALARTKGRIE